MYKSGVHGKVRDILHQKFSAAGAGVQVEFKVDGQHLRLFSEVYLYGHRAGVFDVTTKKLIVEHADGIDDGKKRAEELAAAYLKDEYGITKMPALEWS